MKKKKNKQPSEVDSPHAEGIAPPSPWNRVNLLAGLPVRWIVLGCLTLLVVTTRFYSLETQGFHHDESIHCLHSWQVANQGPQTYRYNPIYHGPFLYHFGGMFHFFSQKETVGQPQESDRFYHHILPDEDWVGRVPFATMGVFLVLVFLFLHRQLGWGTVFLLIAMLILSPVVNYFSRFAREDVHQIAWLAGSIVFGCLYFQSKRVGYLTLVVLFMTLCYCTKENSYMNNFVLGSYVVLWGLFEIVRSPRSTLSRICLDYAPAVRFLVLFGCFSVFVFLYVALDSRVSPETGLWRGIKNILSHSTALTEKIDASALKQETGYFSATGREGTRAAYFRSAFASTTLLLFLFEILVLTIRRRIHAGPSPLPHFVRLGISLLFIGGLIASSVTISGWVQSVEREGFVTELFFRSAMQILGFGILAALFIIPNRLIGRDGKSLFRETLDWWNLGIQLVLAQTIYLFLFTSMGTNIQRGPSTGLYDYIAYWFKHQTGDFRIWGVWWYYLPRLFLYELLPLVLVLLVGISLLILSLRTGLSKWRVREPESACLESAAPDGGGSPYWKRIPGPLVGFAVYQCFFMLAIYAILNEKVPWLLTYQSFALNFLAALLLAHYFATHPNLPGPFVGFFWDFFSPGERLSRWSWGLRLTTCLLTLFLIPNSVGQHLTAVFVRPDDPTELLLYTGTTNQFAAHMERIREMRKEAEKEGRKLKIAVDGKSEWPSAWYFRNDEVRWKTVDLNQDIQILDNTSANQRRMKPGKGKVWEIHPCDLRGWWIWHGTPKALPGELKFLPNLRAFLTNAPNDKRQFFPVDDRPEEKDYVVGFREQILRYVFGRRIWYPTGGERILVCYKTEEEVSAEEGASYLEGVVDPATNLSALRVLGAPNSGLEALNQPRGLARTPEDQVVVADSKGGRILVFDSKGKVVKTIGERVLNAEVTGPCGVDCDSEGNFFVTDTWDHSIKKFSAEGKLVSTFKAQSSGRVRTNLYGPRGIAVGTGGNIYVTDTGNHCVRVFDRDLRLLKTWGGPGDQPSQFKEPVGIAIDAQNQVYVADTGNGRIQAFTSEGEFLAEYETMKPLESETSGIEPDLEFLPDGRLVLSQSNEGTFWVIDVGQRKVRRFAIQQPKVRNPVGLTVTADGHLWVSGRDNGLVCEVKIP